MRLRMVFPASLCWFLLFLSGHAAQAQDDPPRFEIGAHITEIALNRPVSDGSLGAGFRGGYNFSRFLGAEAEWGRFHTPDHMRNLDEALFGIKAGVRTPRTGAFLKIRPGFVHFAKGGEAQNAGLKSLNHFALDLGVVGEHYWGRHLYGRLDLGDTFIFYNREKILKPRELSIRGAFSASFGAGVRF